ncbi:32602_t:CDS:2, partial [Racocetra persica]
VIDDAKAASNDKGKVFEHYSRLVDADRADNISLVKGEVQMSAVHEPNVSKCYLNPDENETGDMKPGENISLERCNKNGIRTEKSKYEVVKEMINWFDNSDERSERRFGKVVQQIEDNRKKALR